MSSSRFFRVVAAAAVLAGTAIVPTSAAGVLPGLASTTTLVDLSTMGVQSDGYAGFMDITPDGRFVAFEADATNLTPGESGTVGTDIYVRDRLLGTTELVSVNSAEQLANWYSIRPSISDDGRYVAFRSVADNLVADDTNGVDDIFVRDRTTGTTQRVSVRRAGLTTIEANALSYQPEISGDGNWIAFTSEATNLVVGDTNGSEDVFIVEWQKTGATPERVSVSSSEQQGVGRSASPVLSRDGRHVAFESIADIVTGGSGHTDIYLRDRGAGTTGRISLKGAASFANGACYDPSISADGKYVAFMSDATDLNPAGDTNGDPDVFVRDIDGARTIAASTRADGATGDNLSWQPCISADGGHVAFTSQATNLVSGGTNGASHIFVRDLDNADPVTRTQLMSVNNLGVQGNTHGGASEPSLAADGELVAFTSSQENLVDPDANGTNGDVFIRSNVRYAPVEQDAGALTFDRWVQGFSTVYSGGGYVYGRWANTNLNLTFYGQGIKWVGPKQPGYGKAEVWLDGVYQTTVDCYQAAPGVVSATLWENTGLAPGTHTIRIKCLGTKQTASTGTVVVIDRFEVETNTVGDVAGRFDEQDWRASFAGTWIKAANPTYFGKGYAYSAWAGTTYTASFYGTKAAWIGPMSTAYGMAAVYLDGAYQGTIDCYSAATGWRYRIWQSPTLARGSHYLQIKPTHTKRAAATNYVVVVDALDVTP